jgi:hypothetical protein
MTEPELQEAVRVMCARLGLYQHHTYDSRRSALGFPDCVIINLRDGTVMWRELKSDTGQQTTDQKRVGYALKAGGHDFAVWRPADLASGKIGRQLVRLAGHNAQREAVIAARGQAGAR